MVDACFISSGILSATQAGEAMLGEWTVDHPKCPLLANKVKRLKGTVSFVIRGVGQVRIHKENY
jgi:hypothetical protein